MCDSYFRAVNRLLPVVLLWFCCSCGTPPAKPVSAHADSVRDTVAKAKSTPDTLAVKKDSVRKTSALEQSLLASGLVDVHSLDSTIVVDLKYSTSDNFLGFDVYGDFDRCFLQPDVAAKLVHAQQVLKARYPYYTLIVYDAVRPLHIQRVMWDTLKLPPGEKQKYLSNPANGSLHNFGAAVDIAILDGTGTQLDMGTKYDYFGELAHPEKEEQFLEDGQLSHRQVLNRELLRSVMRAAGFFNIQTEWWHFNSCRREEAKAKYKVVE